MGEDALGGNAQLKHHHKRQPSSMSAVASTSTITLPSGLSLELALEKPNHSETDGNNKLAVLLHPWSWLGGCMYDPYVINAVSRKLAVAQKLN